METEKWLVQELTRTSITRQVWNPQPWWVEAKVGRCTGQ